MADESAGGIHISIGMRFFNSVRDFLTGIGAVGEVSEVVAGLPHV
jgi:hypothetical protein